MLETFNGSGVSVAELMASETDFVVFGAGQAGQCALKLLKEKGKRVLFVCDNDTAKHGAEVENVVIKSPETLLDMPEVPVLMASDYCREIGLQLKDMGVQRYYYFGFCFDFDRWQGHFDPRRLGDSRQRIEEACGLFDDAQSRDAFSSLVNFRFTLCPDSVKTSPFAEYFHPEVSPKPGDVIADAGAWNGDTAEIFHRHLQGDCKIFSFEPDASNFGDLKARIDEKDLQEAVFPVKLGLWNKSDVLRFSTKAENSMQFQIDEHGEIEIPVTSLDEFSRKEGVSFDLIKMDIEGSEVEALKGAQEVIKRDRPDLQICVYHQFDDLWEIPILIKEILPDYRLYFGHHTQNLFETIVYAKCE